MAKITEYFRHCPNNDCANLIYYTTERALKVCSAKNKPCKSCAVTKIHSENPNRMRGVNNPMYGTSAKEKWKQRMSLQEYNDRMALLKRRHSNARLGARNPMYGKPSPLKSGRGISGVWEGQNFRSLLELAFLEHFFKLTGYYPKTGETHNFKIPLPNGRNYFPDFVDEQHNIYEIKPSRLLNTPSNALKIATGKLIHGDRYIIITENMVNYNTIHTRLKDFKNITFHQPDRVQKYLLA